MGYVLWNVEPQGKWLMLDCFMAVNQNISIGHVDQVLLENDKMFNLQYKKTFVYSVCQIHELQVSFR